ncbi:hypothetical protein [Photobacterium lutimaris]|uniref:Uncharacterized protein n=1 Tax=Photobacterium lutimaris TaxID=388278 RepID=A0A2T3J028_9GAMM|nr:hypothetical protein [Photobacterium lutimaris]PSU34312.1 hypothetical protein C9I99_10030 [Photobacterium lutimaris]TDR75902.1 hypothetical protein DFP78_104265 [Photobacterium lutimaris]
MATNHVKQDNVGQGNQIHKRSLSMHEGIADWCDTCVCEAEPYWVEVAEEMGINMSDYEDGH